MPNRQISIFIVSVVLIQLDSVLSDWNRDFGDPLQYNNGGPYNYGGPFNNFNNYQPSYQSVPLPQTNQGPSTPTPSPSYPYYSYPLPTVISLDGNNNNNHGNKNSNGNSGNNDNFNMLDFLSLWIGSQNCPVYVPYPIPIPIPMSDDDNSWVDVFHPENWEANGWLPGSSSGQSSGGKRKRGRSKRRGKSTKKSNTNTQNSRSSSTTKNKQSSGKSQSSGSSSGKQSSSKRKPQSSSTAEYGDQQGSATIPAGCNTVTVSCSKPDKDYDYEDYSEEKEPCNTNCDKKKVYRTQIVIETS